MFDHFVGLALKEILINLEINDTRMVRWLCNVNSEDRIDVVEHKNRMQMNNMG